MGLLNRQDRTACPEVSGRSKPLLEGWSCRSGVPEGMPEAPDAVHVRDFRHVWGFDQASRGPARFRIAAVTAMPREACTRAAAGRHQGSVESYNAPSPTGFLFWSCGTDTNTPPEQEPPRPSAAWKPM